MICLAKVEHVVCKINHDQVSAEQKLGLTKVRLDLFLMVINPIAPKLTVPNGSDTYNLPFIIQRCVTTENCLQCLFIHLLVIIKTELGLEHVSIFSLNLLTIGSRLPLCVSYKSITLV